ncbi:hypothetical protein PIN31115_02410 [Pandoraea iniqua]|uniref:Uncharacterized protein n=1 Tax=Pandoraea iniqua TaxID=2508288 RepID=A0A5E4V7G4_9BURK|nr:hypothetical protein [Pandoraea iniqua]VVE06800.1 hypothetical protein PIN31115_02410 [Pandoraea iniqua]
MSLGWISTMADVEAHRMTVQYRRPAVRTQRSMGQIYEHIATNLKQAKQRAINADGERAVSGMVREIDDFEGRIQTRIRQSAKRSDFSLLRGMRGDGFSRSVRGQWDVANALCLTSSARRLHEFLLDVDRRSETILSRATAYQERVAASMAAQLQARDNVIFEQAYEALVQDLVAVSGRVMSTYDGIAQMQSEISDMAGMASNMASEIASLMPPLMPPGEAPPPYAPPSPSSDMASAPPPSPPPPLPTAPVPGTRL